MAVCKGGENPDSIDVLVDEWQRERPDLDLSVIGCFARMKRFSAALGSMVHRVLERHGLNPGEFDVLATLRRAGPTHTLIPSQLSAALMTSRAGMTNRLDRLETAGLVERRLDPADRRSFQVTLTEKGRKVIDEALTEHVENVTRLLSCLSPEQRNNFDQALRTLLNAIG